jgi:hypothetical protein
MPSTLSRSPRLVRIVMLFALPMFCATFMHAEKRPPENDVVVMKKGTRIEQTRQAHVVRLEKGATTTQVLQLRDDQILETKSGKRVTVAAYRRIQEIFTNARSNGTVRREMQVPIYPAAHGSGVPIRPGESPQQLLSRPDKETIRLNSGKVASAKQLKALAPYVELRYGVDLHAARPPLVGRAVKVKHPADLKALKGAPDDTIVESHKGTRVRLGDVRRALGEIATPNLRGVRSSNEVQR